MTESTPKRITKDEFYTTAGSKVGSHPRLHDEKEWWTGNGRLGVVILDKIDGDWSWVALAQNPKGGWQAYDIEASRSSIDKARSELFESFEKKLKEGWWK